jgi:hypothetical protein
MVTQIVPVPGARAGSVTWKDSNGTFFMFGGRGYGNDTIAGYIIFYILW